MSPELAETASTFGQLQHRWKNCENCSLCETRTHVCNFRFLLNSFTGYLKIRPTKNADIRVEILFLGEAPGEVEDVLGLPFTGPSGHLLTKIAGATADKFHKETGHKPPRMGVTNIVGCYPTTDNQTRAPNKDEVKACRDRLLDVINAASPKFVVCLGASAKKFFPGGYDKAVKNFPFLSGVTATHHPAFALRNESGNNDVEASIRTDILDTLRAWHASEGN